MKQPTRGDGGGTNLAAGRAPVRKPLSRIEGEDDPWGL